MPNFQPHTMVLSSVRGSFFDQSCNLLRPPAIENFWAPAKTMLAGLPAYDGGKFDTGENRNVSARLSPRMKFGLMVLAWAV